VWKGKKEKTDIVTAKKRKKNSICGRIESKVETKRHVAPERLFRWGNPPTNPYTNTNAQG